MILEVVILVEIELTQSEADSLIAMEKLYIENSIFEFPIAGNKINIPLVSKDLREKFILNVNRGRKNFAKITYQNRVRSVIPLIRLDLGNGGHPNPDGSFISGTHIHIYREGFGDKIAFPLDLNIFNNIDDLYETLFDFMRFCNVTKKPEIKRDLFNDTRISDSY